MKNPQPLMGNRWHRLYAREDWTPDATVGANPQPPHEKPPAPLWNRGLSLYAREDPATLRYAGQARRFAVGYLSVAKRGRRGPLILWSVTRGTITSSHQLVHKKPSLPEGNKGFSVRPRGFEPLTFWSVARRSVQLSYGRLTCRPEPVEG